MEMIVSLRDAPVQFATLTLTRQIPFTAFIVMEEENVLVESANVIKVLLGMIAQSRIVGRTVEEALRK
jgi:hypothetical protein